MKNRSKIPRSVRGRCRFSISLEPFLCDLCASVVKPNNFILFTYIISRYLPQGVSEVLDNTWQFEARGVRSLGRDQRR